MHALSLHAFVILAVAAAAPCDLAIENPGGSRAGSEYKFTVMSSTVPVNVLVTAGGVEIYKGKAESMQEELGVHIPEDARGKTLEIIVENMDGCVVAWSETVQ